MIVVVADRDHRIGSGVEEHQTAYADGGSSNRGRLQSNGQFEFQLAGTAWCTYEIEASADLRNWKVLKSIMLLGSTTNVLDESTNVVKRFYRARLVK